MFASLLTAVLAVGATDWTCVIWVHADWCAPCRKMEPMVNRLVLEGEPIVVIKVDGPGLPWKADEWGAKQLPTAIAYVHRKEVGRLVGEVSEKEFRALLAKTKLPKPARAPPRPRPATNGTDNESGVVQPSTQRTPLPATPPPLP